MARNFKGLGNFNFKLPEQPSINTEIATTDFSQAPREINLTAQEAATVGNIRSQLERTGLTVESLFDLFNEWQSDKTKSIKRFVISLSFILSLTIFAGVNITNIHLFEVTVKEGMSNLFLSALIVILIISFAYYEYLRRKDLEVHTAKISFVNGGLETCIKMVEKIDVIIAHNDINSAEDLFDDFKSTYNHSNSDLNTYKAIKFYKDNLKRTHKSFDIVEKLELFGIYIIGIIGLIAIICSF